MTQDEKQQRERLATARQGLEEQLAKLTVSDSLANYAQVISEDLKTSGASQGMVVHAASLLLLIERFEANRDAHFMVGG